MHAIEGLRQALLMLAVSVAVAAGAAGVWWWVQEAASACRSPSG